MSTSLIICIIGGLIYLVSPYVEPTRTDRLGELGKWAFIVALAAWFIGH